MGSNYGFTISAEERAALGQIAAGLDCQSVGGMLREMAAGSVVAVRREPRELSAAERVRRWLDSGGSYETADIVRACGVPATAVAKAKRRWLDARGGRAE